MGDLPSIGRRKRPHRRPVEAPLAASSGGRQGRRTAVEAAYGYWRAAARGAAGPSAPPNAAAAPSSCRAALPEPSPRLGKAVTAPRPPPTAPQAAAPPVAFPQTLADAAPAAWMCRIFQALRDETANPCRFLDGLRYCEERAEYFRNYPAQAWRDRWGNLAEVATGHSDSFGSFTRHLQGARSLRCSLERLQQRDQFAYLGLSPAPRQDEWDRLREQTHRYLQTTVTWLRCCSPSNATLFTPDIFSLRQLLQDRSMTLWEIVWYAEKEPHLPLAGRLRRAYKKLSEVPAGPSRARRHTILRRAAAAFLATPKGQSIQEQLKARRDEEAQRPLLQAWNEVETSKGDVAIQLAANSALIYAETYHHAASAFPDCLLPGGSAILGELRAHYKVAEEALQRRLEQSHRHRPPHDKHWSVDAQVINLIDEIYAMGDGCREVAARDAAYWLPMPPTLLRRVADLQGRLLSRAFDRCSAEGHYFCHTLLRALQQRVRQEVDEVDSATPPQRLQKMLRRFESLIDLAEKIDALADWLGQAQISGIWNFPAIDMCFPEGATLREGQFYLPEAARLPDNLVANLLQRCSKLRVAPLKRFLYGLHAHLGCYGCLGKTPIQPAEIAVATALNLSKQQTRKMITDLPTSPLTDVWEQPLVGRARLRQWLQGLLTLQASFPPAYRTALLDVGEMAMPWRFSLCEMVSLAEMRPDEPRSQSLLDALNDNERAHQRHFAATQLPVAPWSLEPALRAAQEGFAEQAWVRAAQVDCEARHRAHRLRGQQLLAEQPQSARCHNHFRTAYDADARLNRGVWAARLQVPWALPFEGPAAAAAQAVGDHEKIWEVRRQFYEGRGYRAAVGDVAPSVALLPSRLRGALDAMHPEPPFLRAALTEIVAPCRDVRQPLWRRAAELVQAFPELRAIHAAMAQAGGQGVESSDRP